MMLMVQRASCGPCVAERAGQTLPWVINYNKQLGYSGVNMARSASALMCWNPGMSVLQTYQDKACLVIITSPK